MQVAEFGQLETPILLTSTLNVSRVADALISYMIEQTPAIGVTTGNVNPVVCKCNDGYLNDSGGRHVGAQQIRQAIESASALGIAEGNIGAGTRIRAYGFAGGIGTASRQLAQESRGYLLGTLVPAWCVEHENGPRSHRAGDVSLSWIVKTMVRCDSVNLS
jgi:D-aminopeptidase